MKKEIWKPVKGYEKYYEVSSNGEVRRLTKKTNHKCGYAILKPMMLKQQKDRIGYLAITLQHNNVRKTFKVHRLVAEAFIPNPEGKVEVNHIDGNKQNNCVSNLEWVSHKENINHAVNNNLFNMKTVFQYDLKGNLLKVWKSTMDIERNLGIKNTNVSSVCLGKSKTAGGYIFRYSKE